jgi:hypothetical protein
VAEHEQENSREEKAEASRGHRRTGFAHAVHRLRRSEPESLVRRGQAGPGPTREENLAGRGKA